MGQPYYDHENKNGHFDTTKNSRNEHHWTNPNPTQSEFFSGQNVQKYQS